MQMQKPLKAKAVYLGDSGVGKTSIILRNDGRPFQSTYTATLGANFVVCSVYEATTTVGRTVVELQMWDTAGQERFRSMIPMYLRNARVVFLVFDITSRRTFDHLSSWIEDVYRASTSGDLKLIVLGNKVDLQKQRTVTPEEGQRFAEKINASYFETSALQDKGIATAVGQVAEELILKTARDNAVVEPQETIQLGGTSHSSCCTS